MSQISILKSLLTFFNNRSSWVISLFLGILFWWRGYNDNRKQNPISVPEWLRSIYKNRSYDGSVYLRSFTMQIIALLTVVWSTLLTFVISDEKLVKNLYIGGYVVILLLATIFIQRNETNR